jgi:hypothetical protein
MKGFFDLELASGMMLAGCTLHDWVKIVDFRDKATGYRFQQMIVPIVVEA